MGGENEREKVIFDLIKKYVCLWVFFLRGFNFKKGLLKSIA